MHTILRARRSGWRIILLLTFAFLTSLVRGERLPIRSYTTADGLARDNVRSIVQDSHGFLWFCTTEGLSRFDGNKFVNYGTEHGLPNRFVTHLLEARDGTYWVATAGGLCRFNPKVSKGEPLFVVLHSADGEDPQAVTSLVEDRSGVIWCATDRGVYRLVAKNSQWKLQRANIISDSGSLNDAVVNSIREDRQGALWFGTEKGLVRRVSDGKVELFTRENGLPSNSIIVVFEDRDGRIWIGTGAGLCLLVGQPRSGENVVARILTIADGLASNISRHLFQSQEGRLYVAGGGLSELVAEPSAERPIFRSYTRANGLTDDGIQTIAADTFGNLWLGSQDGGAMKIAHNGFTTYREAEGVIHTGIGSILEDQAGELCVFGGGAPLKIHTFDGREFVSTTPNLPKDTVFSWGWYQNVFQDHTGEWWIATARGILRFNAVRNLGEFERAKLKAIYTTKDGLPTNDVFRAYEDSRGDIWIGTLGDGGRALGRWDRATESFHIYTTADGLPYAAPTAFCDDGFGGLWIGFYDGGVAHYRDGKFTMFAAGKSIPEGLVRALYKDQMGRLWIATAQGGAVRVDDPRAENPHFAVYSKSEGLSSNQVTCITEDRFGRIYLGTGRGLDRLEVATGRIKHYSTADGLADTFINVSFRDHNNDLWFGTLRGVSRLIPQPDYSGFAPKVMIAGLRISGERQAVSELGESSIANIELGAGQTQIEAEVTSPNFAAGESLRFQFKFEGVDRDWSAPTEQRTFTVANLQSGSYRFLVRAVNSDGEVSTQPAVVSFKILRPFWQRWWFITLASLFVLGIAIAIGRYRTARVRERLEATEALRRSREDRLRELERVRKRIASDLHDDIGASLTQISLLSEVVRQRVDYSNASVEEPLETIANSSRDLVDAMGDIVWAINPQKDHLSDLSRRMRSLASDVFTMSGTDFRFSEPTGKDDLALGANLRREVFLIFKESVNNIVKHSAASFVEIEFKVGQAELFLRVRDDGKGFDLNEDAEGHGLASMRSRSDDIGAALELISGAGGGTTITLRVPLDGTSDSGG